MQNPMAKFLERKDDVLHQGSVGLLCNHTSFNFEVQEYLFQSLARRGNLKRIFIPEHGLFAELQDQLPLNSTHIYNSLNLNAEFISLYGDTENSLVVQPQYLSDLDALVIDIQDVGSRYYTFATTVSYLLDVIAHHNLSLQIYVIDRANPAGRQVEGTILSSEYASFVGRPGLPHRHGLTIGELCQFYKAQSGGIFQLHIIPLSPHWADQKRQWRSESTSSIAPSPNMPNSITPLIYTGQCLLEGTNVSEGRGTTRPFEIFGATYMKWIHQQSVPPEPGAILRPLRFVPTFHKFAGLVCYGYQLHLTGESYHSLRHSLKLIRFIRENSIDDFSWRREVYEFRHDRPAIELLAGDMILLDYMNGKCSFSTVKQKMREEENQWIKQAQPYLLYSTPLTRIDPSFNFDCP